MFEVIKNFYTIFFGRPFFYRLNYALFYLGLRGMGFLNYENKKNIDTGEKRFLEAFLKDRKNFVLVDVGANVGGYIKEVIKINPDVSVFGFEPHPKTFGVLKKNTKAFSCKSIEIFNVGLSNKKEKLFLYDHGHNDGSAHASLHKGVIEQIHNSSSISYEVDVDFIDDFVLQHQIEKINLLKIDTEGNELNVLLGAKDSLKAGRIEAIHFEFNEMNVISNTFFKNFWDLLIEFDFYRVLHDGMHHIQTYNALTCEIFAYQNIVAIKKVDGVKFGEQD